MSSLQRTVSIFSPFPDSPLQDKTSDISFVTRSTLYNEEYDLAIFSHGKAIWDYVKNIKSKKIINVIHSEVIDLEEPVLHDKTDYYVGIRPSIVDYIKSLQNSKPVKLIYNPFDFNRFNKQRCKKKKSIKDKIVLFPGSLDYLRYKPLKYLLPICSRLNTILNHYQIISKIF